MFQQPSKPIEPAITSLTGITNTMVDGHEIDGAVLEQFASNAQIVIAHNASFDRKVAERHWPFFAHRHWACSASDIDWKAYGFGGARLPYLLSECGLFHDAHRALDDCHAVLEILARNLPGTALTPQPDQQQMQSHPMGQEDAGTMGPGSMMGGGCDSRHWWRRTVALRRQRSHVRIVSGAPIKSGIYRNKPVLGDLTE
jgi:DNA polymerase III epsilon subunit-like protein